MAILIDADGCPVVDITIKLSAEFNVSCTIFCDNSHVLKKRGVKTITVGTAKDSVDFALVKQVCQNDIVITQDYGLAAMCLAKKAVPINQNGLIYTNDNIDTLLMVRHNAKKTRRAGIRIKGPRKRTKEQDEKFITTLRKILEKNIV